MSQGGVRQQASIPVVLACCVSPPNSGRRSINLRRRFTVKLTTQKLEQMRSVDIGAVAAESLHAGDVVEYDGQTVKITD